jgi:hypothetical protein
VSVLTFSKIGGEMDLKTLRDTAPRRSVEPEAWSRAGVLPSRELLRFSSPEVVRFPATWGGIPVPHLPMMRSGDAYLPTRLDEVPPLH